MFGLGRFLHNRRPGAGLKKPKGLGGRRAVSWGVSLFAHPYQEKVSPDFFVDRPL